jgi:hypothetical protein
MAETGFDRLGRWMSAVGLGCAKTLWQEHRFVMASAMWLSMVILLRLASFRSGIAPE